MCMIQQIIRIRKQKTKRPLKNAERLKIPPRTAYYFKKNKKNQRCHLTTLEK